MADLPVPNADPPAHEGPLTKRSKLQFEDSAKDDQICLSDLHQVYIDRICKNLDLESVIRLQTTCKELSKKGFIAQRLFTCRLEIDYLCEELRFHLKPNCRRLTEKQFKSMNCRFETEVCISGALSLAVFKRVASILEGRRSIEKLIIHSFSVIGRKHFSQFLQDFKVSKLNVTIMPDRYFQLPVVKQLNDLSMGARFTLSLLYLLDTNIHTCSIFLNCRRRDRPDSQEMHTILEKWTKNDKIIKDFVMHYFNWDEEVLFRGWKIIDEGEEVPSDRPIVIRRDVPERFHVIRSDGTVLSVWYDDYFDTTDFKVEELPHSEDDVQRGV